MENSRLENHRSVLSVKMKLAIGLFAAGVLLLSILLFSLYVWGVQRQRAVLYSWVPSDVAVLGIMQRGTWFDDSTIGDVPFSRLYARIEQDTGVTRQQLSRIDQLGVALFVSDAHVEYAYYLRDDVNALTSHESFIPLEDNLFLWTRSTELREKIISSGTQETTSLADTVTEFRSAGVASLYLNTKKLSSLMLDTNIVQYFTESIFVRFKKEKSGWSFAVPHHAPVSSVDAVMLNTIVPEDFSVSVSPWFAQNHFSLSLPPLVFLSQKYHELTAISGRDFSALANFFKEHAAQAIVFSDAPSHFDLVLVYPLEDSSQVASFREFVSYFFSYNFPDHRTRTLPDNTTTTELFLNPSSWQWQRFQNTDVMIMSAEQGSDIAFLYFDNRLFVSNAADRLVQFGEARGMSAIDLYQRCDMSASAPESMIINPYTLPEQLSLFLPDGLVLLQYTAGQLNGCFTD